MREFSDCQDYYSTSLVALLYTALGDFRRLHGINLAGTKRGIRVKTIAYLLVVGLLLVASVVNTSANDIQISQGFTYLNGTAKLSWYGPTDKGDAPWFGLEVDIVSPGDWWVECTLSTGEEDFYYDGHDTLYAREARFIAGISSTKFGLGVGAMWKSVDYSGGYPPHNSIGALATIQTQIPISLDLLTANVAVTAQPIVFGENPLPGEFIELYAGVSMNLSWLKLDAGYIHQYYYNFSYNYQVSGLRLSFQFLLEDDDV